jgi:hypothetical protein
MENLAVTEVEIPDTLYSLFKENDADFGAIRQKGKPDEGFDFE